MWGAGAAQHATEQLTKPQVQSILHEYIDNFIRNEADDTQRAEPWNKNKSRAEATALHLNCYRAFSWKCYRASAELLQSISGTATELIAFSPVSEQPCYRAGCNVSVLLILRAYM